MDDIFNPRGGTRPRQRPHVPSLGGTVKLTALRPPSFHLDNSYTTRFIDSTPELFAQVKRQDRATKLLNYLADVTVNGHPETRGRPMPKAG